jgi:quinol monooxygenase YgiN
MIRHIVFFTVSPEHIEAVRAGLSILTEIPSATRLEIGTNVKTDGFHRSIDLVVYGEFEDEAALAAYKAHPLYEESIRRVKPLREERYAADYVVEDAVRARLSGLSGSGAGAAAGRDRRGSICRAGTGRPG